MIPGEFKTKINVIFAILLVVSAQIAFAVDPPPNPGARQVTFGLSGSTRSAPNGPNEDPVAPPGTGDLLVFSSRTTNLFPGFVDGTSSLSSNIFLRNSSDTVELVSKNKLGGYPIKDAGNNLLIGALQPAISDIYNDANTGTSYAVAYSSDAIDLIEQYARPLSQNPQQIYLRVKYNGLVTTILISASFGSLQQGGNAPSDQPTVALITTGGMIIYRVIFRSKATNLLGSGNSDGSHFEIYQRDITFTQTGPVFGLITNLPRPPGSNGGDILNPTLSVAGDKLFVVAESSETSTKQLYRYILNDQTADITLVSRTGELTGVHPASGSSQYPSVTADGSAVAFLHRPPDGTSGTNLTGVVGRTRSMLVKCNVPVTQTDLVSCEQLNVDAAGTPSSGFAVSGRIDSSGSYAAFADTGGNLTGSDHDRAQVFIKELNGEKRVYLASHLDRTPGVDNSGVSLNSATLLTSRPPVTLLTQDSGVVAAFSSWATNLAVVGAPSSAEPYIFLSNFETPTQTPTPSPTPTSTFTDTPEATPTPDETPEATPTPEPTSAAGSLPVIDLKPDAPISVPPLVSIDRPSPGSKTANITIILPDVTIDPRVFDRSVRAAFIALAAAGARIKYEVEIKKAGSKQRITRVSSRNTVTVRKLTAGSYTVRYRVTATKGKKTIRSKFSPNTKFKV